MSTFWVVMGILGFALVVSLIALPFLICAIWFITKRERQRLAQSNHEGEEG